MLFYIFSILLLFTFFLDERITWYEALLLLVVYGTYVIVMIFYEKLEMKLSGCCKTREEVNRFKRKIITRSGNTTKYLYCWSNQYPFYFSYLTVGGGVTTRGGTGRRRPSGSHWFAKRKHRTAAYLHSIVSSPISFIRNIT